MKEDGMEKENRFPYEEALEDAEEPLEARRKRKKNSKGYFYTGLIVGITASLLVVSIVILAFLIQNRVRGLDGQDSTSADIMNKVQYIEQLIERYYYRNEDIDSGKMQEGIYRGIVDSLGDPYSEYYSQEELTQLLQGTEGIYFGIGAGVQLDTETNYPKIVKVYSGTPAEEAGLREDDIIFEVDGVSTYNMSTTDVVEMIKGEEGTYVNLTIVRSTESDYLSIDVQRRKVNIPTVEFAMYGDMAYIQITEFDDITVDQFTEAMAMARGNNMKGLILDLRSNPGGSLNAVVRVSQMLLPKGLIVYTEDKYGKRSTYECDGTKQIEVPMVVLVNGNSASASEILAGAIKDYGIGTLLGTTTFGKGIVQSVMPLPDNSAVKVTVSSYYTPKGNNIHGIGIEPDIECVFDGEAYYGDPSRPDNQLEEAKKVLKELIEKQ